MDIIEMECPTESSLTNFFMSLNILIGIFFSYFLQHLKVIKKKTSEGISPLYLFLGSCSSMFSFFNIVILSNSTISCCMVQSPFLCIENLMGVFQVSLVMLMVFAIQLLSAIYSPNIQPSAYQKEKYLNLITVTIFFSLLLVILLIGNLSNLIKLAKLLGLLSSLLVALQYFPQIYTTYKIKHAGSLSIPMMLIQTPGGFLLTLTLAVRKEVTWTAWLPYLSASLFQSIVLIQCLYYKFHPPRHISLQDEASII